MSTDIEMLAASINSLKNDSGIAKDILLPVLMSFISAFIGFFFARILFNQQEKIKSEINKVNLINKYSIMVADIRGSLLAIKYNYDSILDTHPINRALTMPNILNNNVAVTCNTYELSFISEKSNGKQIAYYDTWMNVLRISAMLNNYNQIIAILNQRNEIHIEIMTQINDYNKSSGIKVGSELGHDVINNMVGEVRIASLCALTERFISIVDDILMESSDFLINFPLEMDRLINQKVIKSQCTILKFKKESIEITKTIEPDYKILASILCCSVEEAKAMCDNGYRR